MSALNAEQNRARVEEFTRKHRMLAMLFTDIVGSTRLKQLLGDRAAIELIQRHHALVREIVARFPEAEEIGTAGDSFLIVFAKPSDAAHCALVMQNGMRRLREETGHPVLDRIGIHVGEVFVQSRDETARDLFGIQIDTASRVMSLGGADQILLSRFAFDSARQILRGFDIAEVGPLTWLNHGYYEMDGVEEPIEVCEVGETHLAALTAPHNSKKARRFHDPTDEPVQGWRPAPAQLVPDTRWILEKILGKGSFGEVWLARHEGLKEQRVFKFCFKADRARSLKREVTLFKVLRERVRDHPNIVAIHDVFFEEPPFYIMMDYVKGATFDDWAGTVAGGGNAALDAKLEIIAQVADALKTAHDCGVIHRDVKPSNVLVEEHHGAARAKLTDFGIGQVVNAEVLAGVGRQGFTESILSSSSGGTRIYMAPELLAGKPATTRSDIYSLGLILWQTVTGDFTQPLISEWPETVTDPLLREDIQGCVAGDPQKRFADASALAARLRALPERRAGHEATKARVTRRDRRVHRGRQLIAALVLASALAVALLSWDYFRTKINYYAEIGDRWGAPIELLPLDAATVRHRETSYRVESSRRRVRRILRINSSGRPRDDENSDFKAAIREMVYREDGSVERIDWRNQAGRLTLRQLLAERSPGTLVQDIEYRAPSGNPLSLSAQFGALEPASDEEDEVNRSDISVHRTQYDAAGRPTKVLYVNANRAPRANSNGVFGQQFIYDAQGLTVEVRNLGSEATVTTDRHGIHAIRYSRDIAGNITEGVVLDLNDKLVPNGDGYARYRMDYDAFGNHIGTELFGRDGLPVVIKDGYVRWTRRYDEQGNSTEVTYFGLDGKLMLNQEGRARATMAYDERGNLIEVAYFGTDGKSALNKRGYARITSKYDGRDNEIEVSYFGTDGKPILAKNDCARYTSKYDDRGNVIAVMHFGPDGKLVLRDTGYAVCVRKYDENGNQTEGAYFGTDEKPIYIKNGYARFTATFDDRGNEIDHAYFGIDGKPVLIKSGYARFTRKYDQRGNKTEVAFFGVDGHPILNEDGYASFTHKYDEHGNRTETATFGADGEPVLDEDGSARSTMNFDNRGNETEIAYFGTDGEPILCNEGYARIAIKYDDFGNNIESMYWDIDGKPVLIKAGYTRLERKYDTRGNRTESTFFGPDGKPILTKAGCARLVCKFDERGNETERAYFGTNGRSIRVKDGYARLSTEYDDRANIIERSFFGTDGQPVLNDTDIARFTNKYDERGNFIEQCVFGTNGQSVLNKDGFARVTTGYDERGREIESAYFGTDGGPILVKIGFARLTRKYDDRGNNTEVAYFGTEGMPILSRDGYARSTYKYDERGNNTERAYFNTDDEPMLVNGRAREVLTFDEHNREVRRAYFGLGGERVAVNGAMFRTFEHDATGRIIRTRAWRADGSAFEEEWEIKPRSSDD